MSVSRGADAPVARRKLLDEVTDRILAHIRDEGLRPGDRLPSNRALSERFLVATPTLREALRRLEATGAVEMRHGSGVYVRADLSRLIMVNPNRLRLDANAILELLEARELIEPHLAEAAARRATDAQLDELAASLDRAGSALGTGEIRAEERSDEAGWRQVPEASSERSERGQWSLGAGKVRSEERSDEVGPRRPPGAHSERSGHSVGQEAALHAANMSFHRTLGRLAGNHALAQVLDSLIDLHDEEQRHIQALYGDRDHDHHVHLAILAAVRGRAPVKARRLMVEHLRDVRRVVTRALEG
jgi:GntR family transcriptional regulator, transcriptional repressor for pyruvate dehydrogenase complex